MLQLLVFFEQTHILSLDFFQAFLGLLLCLPGIIEVSSKDLNMALLISNQMLEIVRFLHLVGQLVQDRTRLAVEKHASHLRHIVFLGL